MRAVIKLLAIYILRFVMRVLHLFPVKRGRVIFFSNHGEQYTCSPKYISEYLEKSFPGEFEIIWAFKNPKQFRSLKKRGIKLVGYASLHRMYYEATAQVSINNMGSYSWLPLRKGQLHINTWHGGGCYKTTSLGEKRNSKIMNKTLLMTAQETSYIISSSRYFSNVVIAHDFGYSGEILSCGLPRNDILINGNKEEKKDKICRIYSIPSETKLLLYAPTWRYDTKAEIEMPDFTKLKEVCSERFGGNWMVLFRAHTNTENTQGTSEGVINVTKYQDMQELLLASDFLISDYSSCIWDFSLTYRPCMLFTPDLDNYTEERGLDVDIYKWGFPVCKNQGELVKAIKGYDDKEFCQAMLRHQNELGSYEKGNACQQVGELLNNFCFGQKW